MLQDFNLLHRDLACDPFFCGLLLIIVSSSDLVIERSLMVSGYTRVWYGRDKDEAFQRDQLVTRQEGGGEEEARQGKEKKEAVPNDV